MSNSAARVSNSAARTVTPLSPVPTGALNLPASAFTSTPTIFRGICADSWPALHWTDESLIRALPSVRVSRSQSGHYPRDKASDRPCPTETIPTGRLFEELRTTPQRSYVHGEVLPDALTRDCPLPQQLVPVLPDHLSSWSEIAEDPGIARMRHSRKTRQILKF